MVNARALVAAAAILLAPPSAAEISGGGYVMVVHGAAVSGTISIGGNKVVRSSLPLGLAGGPLSGDGYTVLSGYSSQSSIKFASAGVAAAHAYPVPWRQRAHFGRPITLSDLPRQAKISIYTLSGELVRELDKDSASSEITWDLRNTVGREVFSGVYHFWARDAVTGETRTGKLMIIR